MARGSASFDPAFATEPATMRALHRLAGNQVVTRLLAARLRSPNSGLSAHSIQRFRGIPDGTFRDADARVQRLTNPSDFTSELAGEAPITGVTAGGGQPVAGAESLGNTLLTIGSLGVAVVDLQTLLNAAGAKPAVVVDGDFGPATRAAVVAFQSSHDLVPDGIVGSKTTSALVEEIQPGASAAFASSGGRAGGVPGEGPPLLSGTAPAGPINDCVYEPGERDESHSGIGPVDPRIETPIKPVDSGEVVQTFLFSNFGSGDTNLKFTDHLASIRPLIDAFHLDSTTPSHKVRSFEGYSDCVDSFKANVALRRERAAAAKGEFQRIGGLPDNLGDARAGAFHTEPDTNLTPAGRSHNRSVRIVIERQGSPKEDDQPAPTGCPFDDPCECPSDEWELTGIAGLQFVVGIGPVVSDFILRNVKNECCYDFNFEGIGGGFSVGVSASFVPTKGTPFKTGPSVSIADFRDEKAFIEDIGVSVGVGFDKVTLHLKRVRTLPRDIDIGGFSITGVPKVESEVGAFRADGSFEVSAPRRCV